jgi:membrane protease YdiL (CAAX protease family)
MIPEREDPEEQLPFTAGFAVLLALGAAYLQFAFFIAPVIFEWSSPEALRSPARLGIAAILAYGSVFALATRRIHVAPATALGLVSAPRLAWLAALLLIPSVMLVSEVDNVAKALLPLPVSNQGAAPPLEGRLLAEWSVVLIAVFPVVEEVFFRGLVQPPMVEAWGRVRGVVICSTLSGLAFTVGLMNPAMFAIFAVRGLMMGLLRESAGSLQPGLVLNIAFGVITVMAMSEVFGIPGFDDSRSAHTPFFWLMPAAVSTGIGLGLCRALLRARDRIESQEPG